MILDIAVLVVVLISSLIAFLRGFIRESLTLVTLGLALAAAYFGAPHLQPFMEGWLGVVPGEEVGKLFGILPMDIVAYVLSRGAIFLTVLIALSIASHLMAEAVKAMGLGAIDRSLGVVFGLLRAMLVIAVLYLPVHLLVDAETKGRWFANSKTHAFVEAGSAKMASLIPSDKLKEKFEKTQGALVDGDVADKAGEKLKVLNILRGDLSTEEGAKILREKLESGELDEVLDGEGYSQEFRDTIDELFQESGAAADLNE